MMLSQFTKISLALLIFTGISFAQSLSFLNLSDLENVKSRIQSENKNTKEINTLKILAENAIDESPYTITKYTAPKTDGATVNDYYSDSPYWWPVEGDSTAPYVRKDGERYPKRFMNHKDEVAKFYKGIFALTFYSYFTNNDQYAKKATEMLKIWFLDDSTKMNPNLKYAQLIKNRTKLRGVGIIEGRRFAALTDVITLLKLSGQLDVETYDGIKLWYKEFQEWLTKSEYGIDEKERGNNHSTWWAMQVATIGNFLEDTNEIKNIEEYAKHFLLDDQIDKNNRQPLEEERTKSLSYSIFNITAHAYLNTVLDKQKYDNWNYVNKNGVSVVNVIDYLIPFIEDPSKWELQQIKSFDISDPMFLGLAGIQLNKSEYLMLYNELSSFDKKSIKNSTFDPIQIVLDSIVKYKLAKNEK